MKFKKIGILNRLVNAEENNFSIKSNFGRTNFIGVGETPKSVLSEVDDLLQQFIPGNRWGQPPHIIRVEVKMCLEGTQLIEVEQQPAGIGIFIEAGNKVFAKVDFRIAMEEITVLYSEGRTTRSGTIHSDDHLFTDRIHPWKMPRDITGSFIVRSRSDETNPDWLKVLLEKPPENRKMLLPTGGIDKAATYKNLGLPHCVFSKYTDGSTLSPKKIKQILFRTLRDFKVRRVVLKPRTGTRAWQVVTLGHQEIAGIHKRSQIVSNLKRNPDEYVLQPYYRGAFEKVTGICHLYRLFYVQNIAGWQYVGGILALDDTRKSKMVVHGGEEVKHILLLT